MTATRRTLRAATLTVAVGMATVIAPPSAEATIYFRAQTAATAVHLVLTQQPASSLITASLVDDATAYVSASFDTGGASEALAAPAFPGRLVIQGPALLCTEVFTCPAQPPAYPFLADASYPRRAHDTSNVQGRPTGSGPFVVTPLQATARAARSSNASSTRAGAVSMLAGTPGGVDVGSSQASSAVRAVGGRLLVHASSFVSDVTIAGLVHIGSVSAVDDVVLQRGKRPVDHPHILVSGVTVAGRPATIDETGVHVTGLKGPSVTQRLASHGVRIRTIGVHRTDTRLAGRSDATGLAIDAAIPVSGLPYIPNPLPPLPPPFDQIPQLPGVDANGTYVAHITLGSVGAVAGLANDRSIVIGGTSPLPPVPTSAPPPAPPGTTPVAGGPPATVPGVTTGVPPTVAPPAGALRSFVDLLGRDVIEDLYAVLALGTLALFLGWRMTVAGTHRQRWDRRRG
ncbi:MAG: hypothetical protein JO222_03190 [Frankiales bacterium]|nr:hypothetical protein [Frankiales bacterium]